MISLLCLSIIVWSDCLACQSGWFHLFFCETSLCFEFAGMFTCRVGRARLNLTVAQVSNPLLPALSCLHEVYLEGEPAVYTYTVYTPIGEKVGVAPDQTCISSSHQFHKPKVAHTTHTSKYECWQENYPGFNPWRWSNEVQNRDNQWPYKKDPGSTKILKSLWVFLVCVWVWFSQFVFERTSGFLRVKWLRASWKKVILVMCVHFTYKGHNLHPKKQNK